MGNSADHLRQADHNQDCIDYLLGVREKFPDWITTIAFYKAVHLVEAVRASEHGAHSGDHGERKVFLRSVPRYRAIAMHCFALKRASEIARYVAGPGGTYYRSFDQYIHPDNIEAQILQGRLHPLEKSARNLLAQAKGPQRRRHKRGPR